LGFMVMFWLPLASLGFALVFELPLARLVFTSGLSRLARKK
jgi:hypothetical protein